MSNILWNMNTNIVFKYCRNIGKYLQEYSLEYMKYYYNKILSHYLVLFGTITLKLYIQLRRTITISMLRALFWGSKSRFWGTEPNNGVDIIFESNHNS